MAVRQDAKEQGMELRIQADNCGQNKSKYTNAFISLLVELGYFVLVTLAYLIVGYVIYYYFGCEQVENITNIRILFSHFGRHTHGKNDQVFCCVRAKHQGPHEVEYVGSPLALWALYDTVDTATGAQQTASVATTVIGYF